MRRSRRRASVVGAILLAAAAAPSVVARPHSDLYPDELRALRAVFDAEVDPADWERIEIARSLFLPNDSRRLWRPLLERLAEELPAAGPETVAALEERNARSFPLAPSARQRLGAYNRPNAFLISNLRQLHVQYARVGWDRSGRRGLVYLELRPFEGADELRGIFRVVERSEEGWRVVEGRIELARGRFPD